MLTAIRTTTMLPVEDPERAGRFYADMLGLKPVTTTADGTRIFELGQGDALGLRPAEKGAQSAQTAISFEVPDLEAEIRGARRTRACTSRTTTCPTSRRSTTSR